VEVEMERSSLLLLTGVADGSKEPHPGAMVLPRA
jgi:hypothetical protein